MRIYEHDGDQGKLTVDVTVKDDGAVEVFFYDLGPTAMHSFGDSDYERSLQIPRDQVGKLAMHLLYDRFAGDIKAQSKIEAYCEERDIATEVWRW